MRRLFCLLLVFLTAAGTVAAQDRGTEPEPRLQMLPAPSSWRTRLLEADRFLRLEQPVRAEGFLDEAEQLGAPESQVLPRRVEAARLLGDVERVVALCEPAVAGPRASGRLLHALAEAYVALGRDDAADHLLRRLAAQSPNRISSLAEAVELWRGADKPARGLALIDSLRAVRDDDRILQRARAACLLQLGEAQPAVTELAAELAVAPLNLPMVRDLILDTATTAAARERVLEALGRLDDPIPPVQLLRVDLSLRTGREDQARALGAALAEEPAAAAELQRYANGLAREFPLIRDGAERRAAATWLLETLEAAAVDGGLPQGRRLRLVDLLAGVTLEALRLGYLEDGSEGAVERVDRVLDLVRRVSPGSTRLYAARIALAEYVRDVQGDPEAAARSLTRLLTDLDLPLDGVALARLSLGECRLAAGDSAGARTVLTALGRDERFHDAAGRAQYLLACLDLAQGAWETARDRFAAVALADPSADQANDALDLGLTIAEELQDPQGGPSRLEGYARTMWWELAREPGRRTAALREFVDGVRGDGGGLLDRARLELAHLLLDADPAAAAEQCDRIVLDHPDGHHAPAALFLLGEARSLAGDARAARAAWDRLLAQYPDAVEADDARGRLRSLP